MRRIKIFEDFTQPTDSLESLIDEISNLTGKPIKLKYWRSGLRFYDIRIEEPFENLSFEDFYNFIKDNKNIISTYPKLSEDILKKLSVIGKMRARRVIDELEYGFDVVLKLKYKESEDYVNINCTSSTMEISSLYPRVMKDVYIKSIDDDVIEMLFWNKTGLVSGEFEKVEIVKMYNPGELDYYYFIYNSTKTSDNNKYFVEVNTSGNEDEGYTIDDIAEINFGHN